MIALELIEQPKKLHQHYWRYQTGLNAYTIKHETTRDEKGWEHYAYLVRLTNTETGATMVLPYRMGVANTEPPTAADVLAAVLMDASGYENARDIDDYAAEYGIEGVSEAVKLWRQVEEQSRALRGLLGAAYHDAVFPPDDHEEAAARLTS